MKDGPWVAVVGLTCAVSVLGLFTWLVYSSYQDEVRQNKECKDRGGLVFRETCVLP